AIGQYIDAKQPPQLTWSPVAKSRAGANNPMARESVYFLWAAKNIFPQYVPMSKRKWVRRDVYEQNYVSQGYPPVPKDVSKPKRAAEEMLQQIGQKEEEQWGQAVHSLSASPPDASRTTAA